MAIHISVHADVCFYVWVCLCVCVCVCVYILKKETKLGKLFLLVIVGIYIIGNKSASEGESKGDLNNPLFLFYILPILHICVLHNIVSFDFRKFSITL